MLVGTEGEMRNIIGMSQKEYAEKILGIFPRVLMEIEKDKGNPTLETLCKVGKPLGLEVGFVKRPGPLFKSWYAPTKKHSEP